MTEDSEHELPEDHPDTTVSPNSIRFYGSIRIRASKEEGAEAKTDGKSSRMGLRGRYVTARKLALFGQLESAMNLFYSEKAADPDPDGDFPRRKRKKFFKRRYSFLGVETTRGQVIFGKQPAAYYDVAVFTDQLPALGAEAGGAFNAGTDGGLSGTGRADDAVQFRSIFGPLRTILQAQIRGSGPGNRYFIDGLGLALRYGDERRGLDFGAAYNAVLDGVDHPKSGQPKKGDRAFVWGARYKKKPFYFALIHSRMGNHETDDIGRYFSGNGLEIYGDYDLTKRLRLRGTYNYLKPDDDHPGRYRINFTTLGVSYQRIDRLSFHLFYRIDGSRASHGSPLHGDTLLGQFHFNF
jgi:predicted porin